MIQSVMVLKVHASLSDKSELKFVVIPWPLDPGVMKYAKRYFYGFATPGREECLFSGYCHVQRNGLLPLWYEELPEALGEAKAHRFDEEDGSWCAAINYDDLWIETESERSLVTQFGLHCVHRDEIEGVGRALLMHLETLGSDQVVYQSPAIRILSEKL